MRKLVAVTQMTLDGVMQALGGPEEDPSGVGYFDDALGQRSQAAREIFRSSGPDREQRGAMLTVAVQEYIADERPVFGERTARAAARTVP
jgi:hypothetical protein